MTCLLSVARRVILRGLQGDEILQVEFIIVQENTAKVRQVHIHLQTSVLPIFKLINKYLMVHNWPSKGLESDTPAIEGVRKL